MGKRWERNRTSRLIFWPSYISIVYLSLSLSLQDLVSPPRISPSLLQDGRLKLRPGPPCFETAWLVQMLTGAGRRQLRCHKTDALVGRCSTAGAPLLRQTQLLRRNNCADQLGVFLPTRRRYLPWTVLY